MKRKIFSCIVCLNDVKQVMFFKGVLCIIQSKRKSSNWIFDRNCFLKRPPSEKIGIHEDFKYILMSVHLSIDTVLTAAEKNELFAVFQLDFIDTFDCAWSFKEKEKYWRVKSTLSPCCLPAIYMVSWQLFSWQHSLLKKEEGSTMGVRVAAAQITVE